MEKEVIIYTDGSSLGNPGPGGWAAVLIYGNKRKEVSAGYKLTTNNRMEIRAAFEALRLLKKNGMKVTIYTDSRLIVDTINKGWLKNWKKNGWKKADKKPVLNIDLWLKLDEEIAKQNVTFMWVPAHTGIPENELCDSLCKTAAEGNNLLIDENYKKE
jgi:ribonuclease HI